MLARISAIVISFILLLSLVVSDWYFHGLFSEMLD